MYFDVDFYQDFCTIQGINFTPFLVFHKNVLYLIEGHGPRQREAKRVEEIKCW